MHLVVLADEISKEEFAKKQVNAGVKVTYIEKLSEINDHGPADVFLILKKEEADLGDFGDKQVILNSTITTLKDLDLSENFTRINGWPGFLNREMWEVATGNEGTVKNIFEKLGWKYIPVADEPGLVSARIISMIINEAYFALGEEVSSKDEIDIAMKLGTNYPYGPFEWSQKIGLKNIYDLLENLSEDDSRYNIAPAMKKDLFNN